MSFRKNFIDYVKARLNRNLEVISKNLGATLIVWVVVIFGILTALVSGGDPNLAINLTLGLGATSSFLILLIRVMFGRPEEKEEEIID